MYPTEAHFRTCKSDLALLLLLLFTAVEDYHTGPMNSGYSSGLQVTTDYETT